MNSIDVDSDNIVDEMNREMNAKCGKCQSAQLETNVTNATPISVMNVNSK